MKKINQQKQATNFTCIAAFHNDTKSLKNILTDSLMFHWATTLLHKDIIKFNLVYIWGNVLKFRALFFPEHQPLWLFNIRLLVPAFCLAAFVSLLFGCSKRNKFDAVYANGLSGDITAGASTKPNIILILGDDVGYEIPAVNGGQSYATPSIDRMAREGIRFTRFHASPLCTPSRFMLLTGKYNFRNYDGWGNMDTSNNTIADMLKTAGYKTLVAGKWQLGGNDVSVHGLGFDDYMIWRPGDLSGDLSHSRYKDPEIYQNATFLPSALTDGKFGDDMFTDYISNFINNNKKTPFFVYYPICLAHYPFCPAPTHPDYTTWDPNTSQSDTKYFPSMVEYMDTKIGQILDKVQSAGIADNTIVIFVGDNGTDTRITSLLNGSSVRGGKAQTVEVGTNVPMIVWAPGLIEPGLVSNALLDLTDFMPTFANIAGIKVPANYGIIDGKNFKPLFKGSTVAPRKWIFCHFDPDMRPTSPVRWIQDTAYKLYDTTGLFYHYSNDLYELAPLTVLTPQEQNIKTTLQNAMSAMHN